MLQETREAPGRVAELLREDLDAYRALEHRLATRPVAARNDQSPSEPFSLRDKL